MIHIKSVLERATPFSAAVTLLLASTVPTLMLMGSASAAPITNRGLTVTSTVASDDLDRPDGGTYTVGTGPGELAAGDPRNGQQVGHTYTFNAPTAQDLGGFTIEYCDSAFGFVGGGACLGVPTGFSAADWNTKTVDVVSTSGTQTFNVAATANTLILTSSTPLDVAANDLITIEFPVADGYFVNPTDAYRTGVTNGTYFAHIATYATQAAANTGISSDSGAVDDGTVTNNVTTAIGIYTRVQETLNFSVEGDQDGPGNTPDGATDPNWDGGTCDPLTAPGQLKMGDSNSALSSQYAYDAKSYFRLATNSANGVSVSYSGDTLKNGSGTLDIDPIGTTEALSGRSTEQFGLGIDTSDSTFASGFAPATGVTDYGSAAGDAGKQGDAGPIVAKFGFDTNSITTPVPIATSAGVVECSTGAVRYIANIAPETPAGIYQTKINYIASPRY